MEWRIYKEYEKEYILILLTPKAVPPFSVYSIRIYSFSYPLYILH